MIYNEYGTVVNNSFNKDELYKYLDEGSRIINDIISEEAIIVGLTAIAVKRLLRWIADAFSALVDWLQGLKFQRQINLIKKHKDELVEKLRDDNESLNFNINIHKTSNTAIGLLWSGNHIEDYVSLVEEDSVDELWNKCIHKFEDRSDIANNIIYTVENYQLCINTARKHYSYAVAINKRSDPDGWFYANWSKDSLKKLQQVIAKLIQTIKDYMVGCIKLCMKYIE